MKVDDESGEPRDGHPRVRCGFVELGAEVYIDGGGRSQGVRGRLHERALVGDSVLGKTSARRSGSRGSGSSSQVL